MKSTEQYIDRPETALQLPEALLFKDA